MARAHIFLASGVAALLLSATTSVFLYILGASIVRPRRPPLTLVVLAAVVQTLSCFTWAFLICRQYRLNVKFKLHDHYGLERKEFILHLIVGIVPSVMAAIVTGTALGWSEGDLPDNRIQVLGMASSSWLVVTFIVWGATLFLQAAHVVATGCLQKPQAKSSRQRFSIDELPPSMTEANLPATFITHPDVLPGSPESSPPTLVPSEGPCSLRSSFSTLRQPASRPSSSKKAMLVRQHSFPRHSQRSSFDATMRPSQDEGFDSWDTSQVPLQMRETILQTKPSTAMKPSALATIPGSRSPSPAKALEGPFFNPSPSESPPASPLPQPSVSRPNSPPSGSTEIPVFTSVFPPAASDPSSIPSSSLTRTLPKLQTVISPVTASNISSPISSPVLPIMGNSSRADSYMSPNMSSEEHIHPLFRTTSPSPAPSPSLGTVVTAAPEAGQMITEHTLRRMRSGSMPAIPSPLIRSESSPDMWTRSMSITTTPTDAPPVPNRSLSRPNPRPLHQRKRSVSFEANIIPVSNG